MDHFLSLDERATDFLNKDLFPAIFSGKVVLFLGAGASVTGRKYLGAQIIEYYQDLLGIKADTNDLVEFLDIISSRNDFSREAFDSFITDLLHKLTPTESHKVIASIGWCQVITTNLDLLLERAADEIANTERKNKTFRVIRSPQEIYGTVSNNVVKYIKINGCISNRKKYPYIFSTKDFEYARPFHKQVLRSIADFSEDIKFLTIGYSYSDEFAKSMLTHFDSFNYRYKRPIYNLDPFVSDARLEYLREKGVVVLKFTTDELFTLYQEWVNKYSDSIARARNVNFSNVKNQSIGISKELKLALGNNIVQLTDYSKIPSSPPERFYHGDSPTYDSIRRNYDVIKKEKLVKTKENILEILSHQQKELLAPVIFLTGYFGSGKSTFLYRMIYELLHDATLEAVAFEFYEATKIRTLDIGELFKRAEAKLIILTCQAVEQDSLFKELITFRTQISAEQFSAFNILILVSIRENILIKYLRNHHYSNIFTLNVDSRFTLTEAEVLVTKLEDNKLLRLGDARSRKELASRIIQEYDGDSFVSLFSILKNRNFELIVEDAYKQLSVKAREAFVLTSIVYQYKILMPSALLMRLVSKDWEAFQTDILKYDSKDILIQERADYLSGEPDLFFRTKHPVISEILIKRIVKTEDALFDYVRRISAQLTDSDRSAEFFVNLIKALTNNNHLQQSKIDRLFDVAEAVFTFDPHFTLHYAMNLQHRRDEASVKKAIAKIILTEGSLDRRNHRLVHRRAVLNYQLAKISKRRERELIKTMNFIEEARELFEIKRLEDPFSSYSYTDYINLELWVLNNVVLEDKELLILHIKIQDLFDIAQRAVYEDAEKLLKLKVRYLQHINSKNISGQTLNDYLEDLYEDVETRPYALILMYNYKLEKNDSIEAANMIEELEYFDHVAEVSSLLFKYYGRSLHLSENRTKLFAITRANRNLQSKDPLRYHFYYYIAEAYNKNFDFSLEHVNAISKLELAVNPELHEVWRKADGTPEIFTGIVIRRNFYTQIKISELQRYFYIRRDSVSKFHPSVDQKYEVKVHFFVKGVRVELLKILP